MKFNEFYSGALVVVSLIALSLDANSQGSRLGHPLQASDAEVALETAMAWPQKGLQSSYYAAVNVRQESTFFGWPAHRVYEFGGIARETCGASCESGESAPSYELETPIVGVSQQVALFANEYVSIEFGLGGYLKKPTESVGSVFTFGEKLSIKTLYRGHRVELFYRHFSNGSFTSDNKGYDFVGFTFASEF